MSDTKDPMVDDIIAMLDNFAANGGGHMNVDVNAASGSQLEKQVEETKSTDCNSKNMPCQMPTLNSGIDNE